MWEARLSLPQRPGGASRPFYHYWTRKARGKTVGLKLTEDELGLYREWIENNAAMHRYEKQYDGLKAELQTLGFIGQGSISTRRIACGRPACRCHNDPEARHGPFTTTGRARRAERPSA